MDIKSGLSAIGNATVNAASTAYSCAINAGKFTFDKLSAGASKVSELVLRAFPNLVTNTVKAHPFAFTALGGALAGGAIVIGGFFAYNAWFGNNGNTNHS